MTEKELLEKAKQFEAELMELLYNYDVAICAEEIGPEHDRKIDLYLDFMGGIAHLNLVSGERALESVGRIKSIDIKHSKLEYIEK